MNLRKSHVKKVDQKAHNSGLFGIIDKVQPINLMRDNDETFSNVDNSKTRKELQSAVLEFEYRKAQASELTRRIRCV